MKKLLLLPFIALSPLVFGQSQPENAGFEGAWEDVPGAEDEPEQWSSLKTADALGGVAPVVMFQSDDAHTGSKSVRLKNVESFGVVANGIMTNGIVHADFDPENGYVYTDESNADWNTAFTGRPDSVVAWIKYDPTPGDRGKIEVLLHKAGTVGKLPETGATDHWVGKARFDVETAHADWTRISAPFTYFSADNPDYILFVITSGDSTIALVDSEMIVDDIELIYSDASIDQEKLDLQVYANATGLTVKTTDYQEAKFSVLTLDGKLVYETALTSELSQHDLNLNGIYIYQIQKEDQILTGKIRLD